MLLLRVKYVSNFRDADGASTSTHGVPSTASTWMHGCIHVSMDALLQLPLPCRSAAVTACLPLSWGGGVTGKTQGD